MTHGSQDDLPPAPKPSSRWTGLLLGTLLGAGIGAGVLYVTQINPALLDGLKTKPSVAVATSVAMTPGEESEKPVEHAGLPRTPLEIGTLPPEEPLRTIKITLGTGKDGTALSEPVDAHLGLGFPLRLYPLGGPERQPSFAAYPQASTVSRETGRIEPGQMASFEFSLEGASAGLDELHTASQLLAGVKCGDLQGIGFASQGRGAWILAGYRIEVNGKLFAANGLVDANPQAKLIESREKLQKLLPQYEELGNRSDLSAEEKTTLVALHAQVRELNGIVTGAAPWFVEKTPAKAPADAVKQLRITLASGGDKQPGTRNPLYLQAGSKKFLLSSETDPLHDEPDAQTFDISAADLAANAVTAEQLGVPGIGIIGSGGKGDALPDRAKLKRVLIEADGKAVYDSELKPDDQRVLGDVWLGPVAHFDAQGTVVQNAPAPNVVPLWRAGMPAPVGGTPPLPEPPKLAPVPPLDLPPPPLLPPVRSILPTGLPPPNAFGLVPLLNALANLLTPVPPPAAPLISGVRIAPTTPIVCNGDTVTVGWTAAGNTAQIAAWRIDLFGVLPHLPVPLQPTPLCTIASTPAGPITLSGGSARIRRVMPPISAASIAAANLPYLYVQPVVTALNARGQVITAATGSLLPLFPTGTTVAAAGMVRGAVLPPLRPGNAATPSFQLTLPAPPPPAPAPALQNWASMFTTDPQTVQSAWLINAEQPAHFGQIFATHENTGGIGGLLQPAFNTAARPTSGGGEQITVRFEGFVAVPPAPFNSLRAVAHVGFIGGSNPATTGTLLVRGELSAGPVLRNRAGNVSPASPFQPVLTIQTDAGIYNLAKTAGGVAQPMTLVDVPLRLTRARTNNLAGYALGTVNAAAYSAPVAVAGPNPGNGLDTTQLATFNAAVLGTGRVFVTLTFMTTLTSPDPTDAVGIFGVRLIPDPSL
ncbi:MAG: hypothetical protein ACK5TH_02995 [Prosthecobacter sp.]